MFAGKQTARARRQYNGIETCVNAGGGMVLSDRAWTLLVMLEQESRGGRKTPTTIDFTAAYSELVEHGLAQARTITREGSSALDVHLMRGGNSARRPEGASPPR